MTAYGHPACLEHSHTDLSRGESALSVPCTGPPDRPHTSHSSSASDTCGLRSSLGCQSQPVSDLPSNETGSLLSLTQKGLGHSRHDYHTVHKSLLHPVRLIWPISTKLLLESFGQQRPRLPIDAMVFLFPCMLCSRSQSCLSAITESINLLLPLKRNCSLKLVPCVLFYSSKP